MSEVTNSAGSQQSSASSYQRSQNSDNLVEGRGGPSDEAQSVDTMEPRPNHDDAEQNNTSVQIDQGHGRPYDVIWKGPEDQLVTIRHCTGRSAEGHSEHSGSERPSLPDVQAENAEHGGNAFVDAVGDAYGPEHFIEIGAQHYNVDNMQDLSTQYDSEVSIDDEETT